MATFAPTDWMIDELENKGYENEKIEPWRTVNYSRQRKDPRN